MIELINRADALALVTAEEPTYFDSDVLHMEINDIEPVDAIPCDYIRAKAYKAVGPERTYLEKLLNDWEEEHK